MLDRLILREFGSHAGEVRQKLRKIKSTTANGDNRICAAILKLANKNISAIDHLIEKANDDPRDVLAPAEYPGYSKVAFKEVAGGEKKKLYLADWMEYSKWINKR